MCTLHPKLFYKPSLMLLHFIILTTLIGPLSWCSFPFPYFWVEDVCIFTYCKYTGLGKSRLTIMSMETQSLLLYCYLLIIALFAIQTTVNLSYP